MDKEWEWDIFISHASEDKEVFVRPFVVELIKRGKKIWYDDFDLSVGDSLMRKIDNGLRQSKYGVVVLSENFFKKEWPKKELGALMSREMDGKKVILPIWHGINIDQVRTFYPLLADRIGISTEKNLADVVDAIIKATTDEEQKVYLNLIENVFKTTVQYSIGDPPFIKIENILRIHASKSFDIAIRKDEGLMNKEEIKGYRNDVIRLIEPNGNDLFVITLHENLTDSEKSTTVTIRTIVERFQHLIENCIRALELFYCPRCGNETVCEAESIPSFTGYGVNYSHKCNHCGLNTTDFTSEEDLGGGPLTEGYLICPFCGKSYIGILQ